MRSEVWGSNDAGEPEGVSHPRSPRGLGHGGFNVFDLESARAVIDAGEELAAPLLVQTSEGAVKHAGLENMVAIVRLLASRTKAPVASAQKPIDRPAFGSHRSYAFHASSWRARTPAVMTRSAMCDCDWHARCNSFAG